MTTKNRTIYDNLWRKGTIFSKSSEDPQYPARNTQGDTPSLFWRTPTGTKSGSIIVDLGEFSPAGKGTMNFDSGSVEPKVGEILTGATSFSSGKVVSVTKASGTWAGGDAAGSIELEECEGRFNDNENINGSIGGLNILTVNEPDTAAGVDLVRNGEFEAGVGGWTPIDCTLASIAGGQVGNCLELTMTGGDSQRFYQNIAGYTVGKIYRLTGYVKSGTSGDEEYFVSIDGQNYFGTSTGAWVKFNIYIEYSGTSTAIAFWKYTATPGTMLFDEVSVYELDNDKTGKNVNFISLLNHNISSRATEIKATGAWDSGITEQTKEIMIPWNPDNIFHFPTETLRRYWKISVADVSNPDYNYLQIGSIFLGNAVAFNRDYVKPFKLGYKENLRIWNLSFQGLKDADKDEILAMFKEIGVSDKFEYSDEMILFSPKKLRPFIFVFDINNPNTDSYLVRLEEANSPEYQHVDYWNFEMNLIEAK